MLWISVIKPCYMKHTKMKFLANKFENPHAICAGMLVLVIWIGWCSHVTYAQRLPTAEEKRRMGDIAAIEAARDADDDARRMRRRNNSAIVELLPTIISEAGFIESASITGAQIEQLTELNKQLKEELKPILDNKELDDQSRRNLLFSVKRRYLVEINDVLLPFQLEKMVEWNPVQTGLPKLLTESPVGNLLKLTEAQREKIRVESDNLAEEIDEFVHQARRRAHRIVWGELTEEQRSQLIEIVGPEKLQRTFSSKPLESIFRDYFYDLPKNAEARDGSELQPRWTDIDLDSGK